MSPRQRDPTSDGAPVAEGLPAHDHAARRARLRTVLADNDVDALLVSSAANVRWLTGFTGSNGHALVTTDGAGGDRLLTDARYGGRADDEAPDVAVELVRDPFAAALVAGRRLGLEAERVSHASWLRRSDRAADRDVRLVAADGLVESLRLVKDAAELARLEGAAALTEQAVAWLFAEVAAPGRTERELAVALERHFVDLGAEGPGFASIVAAGPNSAVPHHRPTDRPLAEGDLLSVDAGAVVDGYHADHTRTVGVGRVADELAAVHALVVAAQAAGREAARAGATGGDVDRAAREVVVAAGRGEAYLHGTGHGVGLEVHEAPAVGPGATARLAPSTVLTVEPGVYLPGLGGVRVEDAVVVRAEGPPRPLTDTPRGLVALPLRPSRA